MNSKEKFFSKPEIQIPCKKTYNKGLQKSFNSSYFHPTDFSSGNTSFSSTETCLFSSQSSRTFQSNETFLNFD